MKRNIFNIGLASAVILLILGVVFAPGIAASREIAEKIEMNNDLVEITIKVGNHGHSVLLSSDQALELENLIDQTKNRLESAGTMGETSQIFDDTVVSLYKLGVFPYGMNIEYVQRMVNGHNRFSRINKHLDGFEGDNTGIFDNQTNVLCLIAGKTNKTVIFPPFLYFILTLAFEKGLIDFYDNPLMVMIAVAFFYYTDLTRMILGQIISLGYYDDYPACGWVYSIGLRGIKKWNGAFYGQLPEILPWRRVPNSFNFGVRGFTGIKITSPETDKYFYLGTALQVKIGEEPPSRMRF